jgi:D-alanyl-D-alanine carboxypeptidase (penicillin-binding protein 5/6)
MAGERQRFRRGAHSRAGVAVQERLRALGQQMSQPSPVTLKRPSVAWAPAGGHLGRRLAVVVVLAAVVFVAVQWLRPLPSSVFQAAPASSLRLPGTPSALPWPAGGAAAMTEIGVGGLGQAGTTQAVPIASLAKVIAAYVVLKDHPLAVGEPGPAIAVTQAVVEDDKAGLASQQSELQVTPGESLTELQALEGLLLIGANDMATLLGDWDAGTTAGFVAKMNTATRALGLSSVHITDPSGLDPGTVASATDIVRLGQTAMANPVFGQIVGMKQATLPVAGVVYNLDSALGHVGIVGIKTGNSSQAGGCFLFEAVQDVAGQPVTLLGVVLGQQGPPPITAAITSGEALLRAAFAGMQQLPLVSPGQLVGRVVAPWGGSVPVTASGTPTIVSWPGLTLQTKVRIVQLSSLGTGAQVGVMEVATPGRVVDVPLRTAGGLGGPSIWWRLTRL